MASDDIYQYGGVVCSLDDWILSNQTNAAIHCLTRSQTIGLTLVTVAGFASLFAVTVFLALVVRNAYKWLGNNVSSKLIDGPMDLYMLSLFGGNLVQAIGTVMGVKWVHDGKLETGSTCDAQGALLQLGEVVAAMTTMTIALHTFAVLWWQKGENATKLAGCVTAMIWLYNLLYVSLGVGLNPRGDYETPSPFWCYIGPNIKEKITGLYLWLWLTLAISIVVYMPLHLWNWGYIELDHSRWLGCRLRGDEVRGRQRQTNGRHRRTFAMLAYPLVYCVLVLPLSVTRWTFFDQRSRGSNNSLDGASLGADAVYSLSGAFDVLLFFYARPGLLLFTPRPRGTFGRAPSPEQEQTKGDIIDAVSMADLEHGAPHHIDVAAGGLHDDAESDWELPQPHDDRRTDVDMANHSDVTR